MDNILIVKNKDKIIISNNGKRLIIHEDNLLFTTLKDKSKDEIKNWYINRE